MFGTTSCDDVVELLVGACLDTFFFLQLEKLEKFRKRQQPVEAETDEQNEVRKH